MLPARLAISGLLVFGTITSLFSKVTYEMSGIGDSDANFPAEHKFVKPWFCVLIMFIGMLGCLPFANRQASSKSLLLLGLPSAFDLSATILMNIGLIWVNASIFQMMRGAELIFAALFGVFFLKRKLIKEHYIGIFMSTVGITMVGSASMLAGSGHGAGTVSEQAFGMGLIIAAQAVQAAQLTFEDYFMADMDIDAMLIVGMEGLWGTVLCILIMVVAQFLPGSDVGGVMENTSDSLKMMFSSQPLFIILAVQMVALMLYNYSGMSVTGNFSAVFRTVLETLRTLFVWLIDLVLFYCHVGDLGEAWTPYSIIQAAGFVVLVSATLIYSKGDEKLSKDEKSMEFIQSTRSRTYSQSAPFKSPMTMSAMDPRGEVAM